MPASLAKCVGYVRTSSLANADGASHPRQKQRINKHCQSTGMKVVKFFTENKTGTEEVCTRPVFRNMIEYMMEAGISTIIVEDASRFARDLLAAEVSHKWLKSRGITLISAACPDQFIESTPTSNLVRQIVEVSPIFRVGVN